MYHNMVQKDPKNRVEKVRIQIRIRLPFAIRNQLQRLPATASGIFSLPVLSESASRTKRR